MQLAAARGQQLYAASSCTRPAAVRGQQLYAASSCTRPAAARGQQLHAASSCTRPAAARGQQLHVVDRVPFVLSSYNYKSTAVVSLPLSTGLRC